MAKERPRPAHDGGDGGLQLGGTQSEQSQAQYTREKTKTLQEYKECIDKAQGDDAALEQCELLLKAVQAAEGAAPPD